MNDFFFFFLLATMLLLCCFSWEETFGWLSTAYVRLSANTSFQSSASCCHSSRCAHQLNPLSCGWAGWQVSGQHLSLQLSVFPSVPALPHSTDLTSTLSTSNLHVEIKLLMVYLTLCFRGAQEFFVVVFFNAATRWSIISRSSPPLPLRLCESEPHQSSSSNNHYCSVPRCTFSSCQSQL